MKKASLFVNYERLVSAGSNSPEMTYSHGGSRSQDLSLHGCYCGCTFNWLLFSIQLLLIVLVLYFYYCIGFEVCPTPIFSINLVVFRV
jgi:hypothetical protein